ncbi:MULTISPECIES: DUF1593 domain-containing protein [unclassified Novosphingobium]|uniref:DUF1593 domain-containing protein n=1 Tax=unclassified Novosphingobium TaxID=2644732 RepID=UPI0017C709B4|nr:MULTISPECIES: DUF1593 domain-containing protein [unclassified Novosphingobium]MBB3360003.1 hypothetical protein [Novosphingobium sp. BK256]MBB3376362.1 hypothetical protein [Novosphingobium sp. BK280]MBB3380757.1 hypothetical protein [Novosphingobium sp. BK258]MBB3422427.1 hypothetical protein [Novosphingobium sp. BK267]MBB3451108.1 hypothetical protein [Novosphingobium sp. BK352]
MPSCPLVLTAVAAFLPLSVLAGTPASAAPARTMHAGPTYAEPPASARPRVVITTDPELDDFNSLLRFLLYAPDFKVEGLVYASSQFHWKGDGKGTARTFPGREYNRGGVDACPCTSWRWAKGERFIDKALDLYAQAWPNLRVHNPAYPSPAALRAKVRWGNVAFDGDISEDTAGSELIRKLLLDDQEAPVYLHAWGGQSTIARALKRIEDDYAGKPEWAAIRAKVIRKAVIQPSGDQDDTYAKYIKPHWPEIRYNQQSDGASLAYFSQLTLSAEDAALLGADWTRRWISSRGPIGAAYRVWGDGKQMVPGDKYDYFGIAGKTAAQLRAEGYHVWAPIMAPGSFISEGDTPTFLNLVNNGLQGWRDSSFGGWGGVHSHSESYGVSPEAGAAIRAMLANPAAQVTVPRAPTSPFFRAVQNDFAARLLWAVTPRRADANHAPVVQLAGPVQRSARAGALLDLSVRASDPDGNRLALRWWPYAAAGTYPGTLPATLGTGSVLRFQVPADAKPGQTLHLIAEASDDGTPALTHYARVVVTVTD